MNKKCPKCNHIIVVPMWTHCESCTPRTKKRKNKNKKVAPYVARHRREYAKALKPLFGTFKINDKLILGIAQHKECDIVLTD